METVAAALEAVAGQLVAAGLPTVLDPADADLPSAVLYPALVDFERLAAGDYTLTVDVLLVAGGVRVLSALDQLDKMVTVLRGVFPIAQLEAVTALLPSQSPDPLPAYRASVIVSVTE